MAMKLVMMEIRTVVMAVQVLVQENIVVMELSTMLVYSNVMTEIQKIMMGVVLNALFNVEISN